MIERQKGLEIEERVRQTPPREFEINQQSARKSVTNENLTEMDLIPHQDQSISRKQELPTQINGRKMIIEQFPQRQSRNVSPSRPAAVNAEVSFNERS